MESNGQAYTPLHISAILPSAFRELSAGREAPVPRAASYGFAQLDELTDGLHNGDLIVLGGRPGMGKSSLALNILSNVGMQSGKNVVYFSLERAKEFVVRQLLAQAGQVSLRKMEAHQLTDEDWAQISAAALALDKMNIYIDDFPTNSVKDMERRCRQISHVGLVVVDSFQLVAFRDDETEPEQAEADLSAELKAMAQRLGVPVLCLTQLPRSIEARPNKKPVLRDLREVGNLERDADVVIMLYREAYYDYTCERDDLADCIVVKNRHGVTWRAGLRWSYRYAAFSDAVCEPDEG